MFDLIEFVGSLLEILLEILSLFFHHGDKG